MMRVPFLDLAPSHSELKRDVLADIGELIDTGRFANGPQVAEFETAFASYCGTRHCVGTASGLDALRIALVGAGLRDGDEVIVPANTFVATAEAVTQAGGRVVLADVSETDYNIDPAGVEAAVSERTRFVIPVHLYGQLADMRALLDIAARRDLRLIEDACQAHGATRAGIAAGAAGVAAAFSFYPGKNLGAFGDAGAIVTNSDEVSDVARALREHGQRTKYHHDYVGWTARLDTIQAIALNHKLPHLARWNEERRDAAAYYMRRLHGVGDLALPPVALDSQPVWHLFVVRTGDAHGLAAHLEIRGVATGRHYPQPIHLSGAYRDLGRRGAYPVTERLAHEGLSLPIFPGIAEAQLDAVVSAIEEFFARA